MSNPRLTVLATDMVTGPTMLMVMYLPIGGRSARRVRRNDGVEVELSALFDHTLKRQHRRATAGGDGSVVVSLGGTYALKDCT